MNMFSSSLLLTEKVLNDWLNKVVLGTCTSKPSLSIFVPFYSLSIMTIGFCNHSWRR